MQCAEPDEFVIPVIIVVSLDYFPSSSEDFCRMQSVFLAGWQWQDLKCRQNVFEELQLFPCRQCGR